MQLGTNLFKARKKSGLSQEEVAAKLGVSRQTISKWELDETLPDIRQAKKLAGLYHLTLDELIDFDTDLEEIQQAIHSISEEKQKKVDCRLGQTIPGTHHLPEDGGHGILCRPSPPAAGGSPGPVWLQ